MLYRPEDFEPVAEAEWDVRRVRAAIGAIVRDADEAYRRQPLWPPPPNSPVASGQPEPSLHAGAPGVAWALDALAQRGHAESDLDPASVAVEALEAWRANPVVFPTLADLPQRESSLLAGEAGVLLVAWRLTGRPELADDLYARVCANVHADEVDEIMWGTAGTLLIATELLARTGEDRWRGACRDSADALLARRDADGLWVQRRFKDSRSLGPVHGLVGNVHALLNALDAERAADLRNETNNVLTRYAVRERGHCNWPAIADEPLGGRTGEIRLQWCHGAPGIVTTTAPYLDEELLVEAAELTWAAGAHLARKGAGICHGTAGNGYALLAALERTGDELWLERARRFAVHALAQAQRESPVYSLWLGGIGAAVFASDCLDARCRYPFFG
jgi:lantibiotic modifying enzyme